VAGTHIDFVRSGGLGGLRLSASVDVDALPPDMAAQVGDALGRVDLGALADRPTDAASGADRFQYDITVNDASGAHTCTVHEPDVPPGVWHLIEALLPLAKLS